MEPRWGKCLDGRVYILAALVIDVEVALPDTWRTKINIRAWIITYTTLGAPYYIIV